MESIAFAQLFLLVIEILTLSAFLLGLFRLKNKLGLVPFYMALGALQQLQAILALTVYLKVTPGIVISPGSSVLLTGVLFTILLVYIREDAPEARKLIYGLLTANVTVAILSFLIGLHLNSRFVINTFGLRPEIFFQGFRVMLVGTVALVLDVFLILILYEAVSARIKGSLFLRIYTSMLLVLAVDTLLFVTGSFVEKPDYWSILGSGLVGKAFAAALYSMILTWYLRVFLPTTSVAERDEIAPRDLFDVLTYRQRYEAIRRQVTRDPLTHIYNRGFFENCLSSELARNKLLGWSTALLMIDLDDFKALNDLFGHQFGDQILTIAGQALQDCLRASDFPCRYGGDEFVAILSNSNLESSIPVAQRFQTDLERLFNSKLSNDATRKVSATVGIAFAPQDGEEPDTLVRAADRRLYIGKQRGRNCIVYDDRPFTKSVSA